MELDINKIKRVLKKHPVEMAFLFGSHARGKAGKLSDIDIAVLYKGKVDYDKSENQLFHDLAIALKTDNIDLVNIEETSPLLAHRAVIKGIPLLEHDRHREAQLCVGVLREYENTRYLRQVLHNSLRK